MGRESKDERDASFTAFMTDATPSLLRTAWLVTGSHDRAQELVQAAFVKTYAEWPSPMTALCRRSLHPRPQRQHRIRRRRSRAAC
ncbi:hypothetical protein [Knoellia subterranea]|uniref:RNA polymerase sigma-70 region 2 domain-containing protein n=1 Tax=Knoellia subterranea KCTC 19937 TaxID=1385521 RepID=A0A0A0JVG1_9MICO|nr:hypothetical protein [Knoellia subterranea]KGN39621.1 hypothetical protein N803_02790 [Knoellia subterranea KCTC 19937]